MNRSTLSFLVVTPVVAALVAVSAATADQGGGAAANTGGKPQYVPVQHTDAICPQPVEETGGTPAFTAYAPGPIKGTSASRGRAAIQVLGGRKSYPGPQKPGSAAAFTGDRKAAGTVVGAAEDDLAPGFNLQQTLLTESGLGRGLSGLNCPSPGRSFWFAGGSTDGGRSDTVSLINTGAEEATVDIALIGKDGPVDAENGRGIRVPSGGSEQVRLDSLGIGKARDLAVHVIARSGRIAAALQAVDGESGSDWIPAAGEPAARQTVSGVPGDAGKVRLIVANPSPDDASITLKVSGRSGSHLPTGTDSLDIPAGTVSAVDLGDISHGEASALLLTPAGGSSGAKIVAAAQVVRGKDGKQDAAHLTGTEPVGTRGSVAGATARTGTLTLTAPERKATVRITYSAPAGGGKTAPAKTVEIPKGATVTVPSPKDSGKNRVGTTVETLTAGAPVHATQMLAVKQDGIPMFTVQPITDDRGQVLRPRARQTVRVLF